MIRDVGTTEDIRGEKEYEQQCPRWVHTHPTAYLAQTPQLVIQYVPESGAHAD